MNRDWHHNPSQGNSRSAHDYGNSGPIEPMSWQSVWSLDYVLTAVVIFLVVVAAVSL